MLMLAEKLSYHLLSETLLLVSEPGWQGAEEEALTRSEEMLREGANACRETFSLHFTWCSYYTAHGFREAYVVSESGW